jgi:F-type H+-transporting ATPase subunit gamma
VVTLFYNRFQSVISQIPTAQQVIPAKFDAAGPRRSMTTNPSEEAILADLLPRGVATQVFTALLENGASEQGARMSAMDNATRNAGDMINRLTDDPVQPLASGRDHQRAYRNHFGRRGALTPKQK